VALMDVPRGDGVVIVTSQGGAPQSPVWHENLVAHPEIEVQCKRRRMKRRARRVDDEERTRRWPVCLDHDPAFGEYQARTDRNIPVFLREP